MTLPTTLLAAALAVISPLTGTAAADRGPFDVAQVTPAAAGVPSTGTALDAGDVLPAPADVPAARLLREGATSMAVLAPTPSARPLLAGATEDASAPALLQSGRRGVPLMAAGGALLVAGLLIGGDVGTLVALGGAVIGAYGVFLYF